MSGYLNQRATMIYRIEISTQPAFPDARGELLRQQANALGIEGVQAVKVSDLYFLQGDLDKAAVAQIAHTLLCDPVVEEAYWFSLEDKPDKPDSFQKPVRFDAWQIEVTLLPGVTDSVAESLMEGAHMIGLIGLAQAATGRRYTLTGHLDEAAVRRLATRLLANEVIQTFTLNQPIAPPFIALTGDTQAYRRVETIPLTAADETELRQISQTRRLSLDLAEMQAIQSYYRAEGRQPTDVELEMLAQTWSEHCVHKTFKAVISFTTTDHRPPTASGISGQLHVIDSLLKTYIRAATEQVNKPWVRSAFVDNAGIIAFDEQFDLSFKVETHNHPSALEPFGGANTGVGGVVRDIIGVSARPIANTDVLCFGPPDLPFDHLPTGVLHPRRIAAGVIAGIEDYGNKMGLPTVNGAILYDAGYTANPLVFCGCLGILPRNAHPTQPQVGDLVVVVGGRTGRDGLRGATFSSMEMDHQTSEVAGSAVQIGHPIHEKQAMEAILQARDERLYTAITDCGAGGLSSAVGEMARELGAIIHLERVPLKYPGLSPWEIWLSEAQERMVLAVPPSAWPRLQTICQGLDIEATELGAFTGDGRLHLYYDNRLVGQISIEFLHDGIPRRQLSAVWTPPGFSPVGVGAALAVAPTGQAQGHAPTIEVSLTDALLTLLSQPETRSKEEVVRQYDHEVQGGTVVKPFVGPANTGPGDAAVLAPLDALRTTQTSKVSETFEVLPQKGVALSAGINPFYGLLDPYAMAWAVIDEAIRNVVAVGADPDQIALLDNFCWGNPSLPDRLGSLVRCAQGCYEAAVAYGTPFISGKDSLNNEYTGADGQKHAIPGTLLISGIGLVPDITRTVTSDLKQPGNRLYLLGFTADELGGSAYYRLNGQNSGQPPQPPANGLSLYRALHQTIQQGLVKACHDCSEGGLAVAAVEMALGGGLGLEVNLGDVLRPPGLNQAETIAFSESAGRLLVEVALQDSSTFEALLTGQPFAVIGQVRTDDQIHFTGPDGQIVIETNLAAIEEAWRGHLQN
jgi:phosphoribosylformylglycinamidine synthase